MIRPYREEDFESVARFWFDAVQIAEPELVKRMGYEFEGAREYFKTVVAENQMWVYEMDGVPRRFSWNSRRLYRPPLRFPKFSSTRYRQGIACPCPNIIPAAFVVEDRSGKQDVASIL
jgi:hypothetical protein